MQRWDDVRLFLEVARAGTLTVAGADLGLNPSTLHRRVARLESELGVVLFGKGPRGYELTEVGEALLPRALEMEEAMFAALRTVTQHDGQARGELRITLPLDLVPVISPHLVGFRERYPGIRVELSASAVVVELGRGTDIALRASRSPAEAAVGRKIAEIAWCSYSPVGGAAALPWVEYAGLDHVEAVKWRRRRHGGEPVLMRVDGVAAMRLLLRCTPAQGMLPCYVGDPDEHLERGGRSFPGPRRCGCSSTRTCGERRGCGPSSTTSALGYPRTGRCTRDAWASWPLPMNTPDM